MNKRVLFISIDGLTDPLGQSQILPYLSGLSSKGYSITVISSEKDTPFATNYSLIKQICNQASIEWIPVKYRNYPPIFGSMLMLNRIKQLASLLNNKKRFHLIHCRSYLAGSIGCALSKKHTIPFLFDMRGLWADEKVEAGIWNLKNPIHRTLYHHFKAVEKRLFIHCAGFISLTKAALPEIYRLLYPEKPSTNHAVIPCCTDTNHFDPDSVNPESINNLRSRLNIPQDKTVMTYLGSLSTWYLPQAMFDLFQRLQIAKADSIFLIVTKESPDWICVIFESYLQSARNYLHF